jgi:phage regulator Rha-like protein
LKWQRFGTTGDLNIFQETDMQSRKIVPQQLIESKILVIRGKKVMLDRDLAVLYGVETKILNRAVKRNAERFPEDFMFQLNKEEYIELLRCQFGTLKRGQHRKYLPYAFTENGVAMLSSVLNSKRAIQVNIQIMRAFTKIREMLATHKELKQKIEDMEKKYDYQFRVVFDAIKQLIEPPQKPRRRIGFLVEEPHVPYESLKGSKKQKRQ